MISMKRYIYAYIPQNVEAVCNEVQIQVSAQCAWQIVSNFQRFDLFIDGLEEKNISIIGTGEGQIRRKDFSDGRFVIDQLSYVNHESMNIQFNILYSSPDFKIRNLWEHIYVKHINSDSCIVGWEMVGEPQPNTSQAVLNNFLDQLTKQSLQNIKAASLAKR